MIEAKEYKSNAKLRKVAFVRIQIDRGPCDGIGFESVCNATEKDACELYDFFEAWQKRRTRVADLDEYKDEPRSEHLREHLKVKKKIEKINKSYQIESDLIECSWDLRTAFNYREPGRAKELAMKMVWLARRKQELEELN